MDTNSKNIHTACNMAQDLVELQMGTHMIWEDRADGSEGLTEDAQDLFAEIYHSVMIHLEKHDQ
jgi:hypothetical protein